MAERIGQQLGNYRLTRLLGQGTFADVYLGEHTHLGTQAAIKVLYVQLTSEGIEQFRLEARTIAHLEHPHIVRVLDFGVEDGTPFLVMSYAPNGTLRQLYLKLRLFKSQCAQISGNCRGKLWPRAGAHFPQSGP